MQATLIPLRGFPSQELLSETCGDLASHDCFLCRYVCACVCEVLLCSVGFCFFEHLKFAPSCHQSFFVLPPHQAHVIPALLCSLVGPLLTSPAGVVPQDMCVCAPTGCGKTLCYVVPIVTALWNAAPHQVEGRECGEGVRGGSEGRE